ncbi:MAG: tetratricopeptide repeat protein, partial [Polyangiaceae bacterium]
MDPSQLDSLVLRLVANPHDEEALAYAHQAGASDPKSYALLLERVGIDTPDAGYASHWLSEAANVWSTTLGDAHRAARVLMQAIDRDPTQSVAAGRLAQLYRDKGDVKALVALLERRAKALATITPQSSELRAELRVMHEELGRLWQDNLQQPKKAQENFRRAEELASASSSGWTSGGGGPKAGSTGNPFDAFARSRGADSGDPGLQQEYAAMVVDRIAAGERVPDDERLAASGLLAGLAEMYDGEHGFAYSAGALDIDPGHDRALQLYAYYAQALAREDDVATRYLAYLEANPSGSIAGEARWLLAASYEEAGEAEHAIQILEPLRAMNDAEATAKLTALYEQIGRPMPAESPAPHPDARAGSTRGEDGHTDRRAIGRAMDRVDAALVAAQGFAKAGKRPDAYKKYREVLEGDPAHPEALAWVEEYLRAKRDYPSLRDVLTNALRAPGESTETRSARLRELAGLCEGNLRDVDGAVGAWKQLLAIDRGDDAARQSLTRILERAQRWDELTSLLEQEANGETDIEKKLVIEKKLATIHEQKRRDPAAAAEAWERIANLTPENDQAIATAVKMFEKIGAVDRAAQVIAGNAGSVVDPAARAALFERLGVMCEKLGDPGRAGEAYADAARSRMNPKLLDAAERSFVAGEIWDRAGEIATQRAELEDDPKSKARHMARGGDYAGRAGDEAGALAGLSAAAELDPTHDEYAQALSARYTAAQRWDDLVQLLVKRGDTLADKAQRVAARRQAATLYASELGDGEAARAMWRKVLQDGHDEDAIEHLVEDATERGDFAEAATLLHDLELAVTAPLDKARIALR